MIKPVFVFRTAWGEKEVKARTFAEAKHNLWSWYPGIEKAEYLGIKNYRRWWWSWQLERMIRFLFGRGPPRGYN